MPDNEIDKAKQKAIDAIKIDQMSKAAYAVLIQAIETIFTIEGGKIQGGKDFVKQLNKLTVEVLDLLQNDVKFTGPVSSLVKRMSGISDAITDFQKEVNGIKVPPMRTEQKIVIDETLEQMVGNGLNQNFVQPLRDLIYQNVTSGLSLKDAREAIKEYIQGGKDVSGKLGSYIEQTAQQATDAYSGILNKKILEQFPSMNGLLMTGTLIDNSSPQCIFVRNELGGRITKENWPQVVAKATKRFKLVEGTTFENLPLNKLHWGCRHSFYPIKIKKTA